MVIATCPIWIEIIYDKWLWKNDKDDKPISTILRAVFFILISIFFWAVDVAAIWQGGVLAFGMHLLFFDYSLNLGRGLNFFYHSEKDLWNRVPFYGELFIKLVIAYSCWVAFFHLSWITDGDTPVKLYEYFMF